jgi:HK97 family phage prohead protease
MEQKRYRSFDVEVKAEPDSPTQIEGYACVFDSPSVDLGGFVEVIKQGAFTDSLQSDDLDVIANIDHDNCRMLARYSPAIGADTLTLTQDDHGLLVAFDIPDTTDGHDVVWHLSKKNVSKMSFCFVATEEEMSEDGKTRTVVKATLHDVSIVLFPAYEATEVELREVPPTTSPDLRRKQLLVRSKLFA